MFEYDFKRSCRRCYDIDVSGHFLDRYRMLSGYIRWGIVDTGAVEVDGVILPVSIGNEFISKMELLSAQPVLDPRAVNGAVVVPQSHTLLWLPWTDTDGRNVKQFSVLVCAVSVRVGKVISPLLANATVDTFEGAVAVSVKVVSVVAWAWAGRTEVTIKLRKYDYVWQRVECGQLGLSKVAEGVPYDRDAETQTIYIQQDGL